MPMDSGALPEVSNDLAPTKQELSRRSETNQDNPDPVVEWNCSACSFLNNPALSYCEICETPRDAKGNATSSASGSAGSSFRPPLASTDGNGASGIAASSSHSSIPAPSTAGAVDEAGPDADGSWACTVCSFLNVGLLPYCEMCEAPKPKGSAAGVTPSVEPVADLRTNVSGPTTAKKRACPLCSFENLVERTTCEICDAPLPSASAGSNTIDGGPQRALPVGKGKQKGGQANQIAVMADEREFITPPSSPGHHSQKTKVDFQDRPFVSDNGASVIASCGIDSQAGSSGIIGDGRRGARDASSTHRQESAMDCLIVNSGIGASGSVTTSSVANAGNISNFNRSAHTEGVSGTLVGDTMGQIIGAHVLSEATDTRRFGAASMESADKTADLVQIGADLNCSKPHPTVKNRPQLGAQPSGPPPSPPPSPPAKQFVGVASEPPTPSSLPDSLACPAGLGPRGPDSACEATQAEAHAVFMDMPDTAHIEQLVVEKDAQEVVSDQEVLAEPSDLVVEGSVDSQENKENNSDSDEHNVGLEVLTLDTSTQQDAFELANEDKEKERRLLLSMGWVPDDDEDEDDDEGGLSLEEINAAQESLIAAQRSQAALKEKKERDFEAWKVEKAQQADTSTPTMNEEL